MSEMTTNTASDDTLIRDSQISGFNAFKERLGLCCCRIFKKSHTYDLTSVAKNNSEEVQDKPSYVNQAFQREKQARKDKLDKIARTLPPSTPNGISTSTSRPKPPTRPLTTVTQGTPRSGIGSVQTRTATANTPNSKVGISAFNKASNIKNNKKSDETSSDETSEDESSEEEDSSSDDKSSDSERKKPKKPVPNKRR
ncbi:hypothetical protein I4U23_031281 [Adineta vaga]|nr:hypothetical protein I4U23_031281 [Adineta vaga]